MLKLFQQLKKNLLSSCDSKIVEGGTLNMALLVKTTFHLRWTMSKDDCIFPVCLFVYVAWLNNQNSRRQYSEFIITLQPLYNTVRYNTVLDITWFKDGSQKCIDYIEK